MIKKIPAQQLIKGMLICATERNWLDTPFYRPPLLLESGKQIQQRQEY